MAPSERLHRQRRRRVAVTTAGSHEVAQRVDSWVQAHVALPGRVRRQQPKVLGAVQLRVHIVLRVVVQRLTEARKCDWSSGRGNAAEVADGAAIAMETLFHHQSHRCLWGLI